ncbi:MAG: metal ABC transporter permease [Planctomycetes bacterium]|nr:metal ABC transporter permease [Planctomycetota bacterium]
MDLEWSQVLELFGFAIAAALLAGLVCPLIGCFLYVRRTSFYGIVLPQFAAAGVAFGFAVLPWWAEHVGLGGLDLDTALSDTHAAANYHLAWASTFTFGGLFVLSALSSGKGSEAGRLASGFALAGALAILFTHWSPAGENFVNEMLRGEILAVGQHDFETLAVALLAALGAIVVFHRDFVLVSFDREMAIVLGKPVRALEFSFLLITGAIVSVGAMTVGPIVLFGMLVIPPLAARMLARSMLGYFALASTIGVLSAAAGVWASLRWNLPMAPAIVVAAGAVLLLAAAFARLSRGRS